MFFVDRQDAGRRLGRALAHLRAEAPVVVGLTRGGVPVAAEVARALGAELDLLVVRKLGAPHNPEYAVGAIAEGGGSYLNRGALAELGLRSPGLEALVQREAEELERRVRTYRAGRARIDLAGRTVLVVDDGIATGATIRAAVASIGEQGARRVIVATPVVAPETRRELSNEGVEVFSLEEPESFMAVAEWYRDFPQVSDAEVLAALDAHRAGAAPPLDPEEVEILAGGESLVGTLTVPRGAQGVVVFVHGSGSSRFSPRNRFVAGELNRAGFATLLMDLLTVEEEDEESAGAMRRFDIGLLTERVIAATRWLERDPRTAGLPVGHFGASTGAAAALEAAAALPGIVAAVVSRGGRPDLASAGALAAVRAPTLLIVGGSDEEVLAMNREALAQLRAPADLAIVPGATHLFEESGALEQVAELATQWFERHLAHQQPGARP